MLEDILKATNTTSQKFFKQFPDIKTLTMTSSQVIEELELEQSYYNKQISLPECINALPKSSELTFIPLCSKLQEFLQIEVHNLDD